MSMYRCPACGELFSTSYKKCPFCEEDDLMSERSSKKTKKRGGSRRSNEPRAIGPALVIVLLLIVALVVFLFKGSDILTALKHHSEGSTPPVSDVTDENRHQDETGDEDASAQSLTLSSASLELDGNTSAALTASGGSGTYTWSSDNEAVATVTDDGNVTAVSGGTAIITVSDGESSAVCSVTVKAEAVELTISKTDVSIRVGESFNIGAKGGTITYRSEDPDIAVVGADGVVTGKGYGKTNIYASNGSMELGCIVRVK